MNLLKDLSCGSEEEMTVVIEIPQGSRNKYEYDKKMNVFVLDRVLYSPFHYPADYGFVPQTHCEDGDPLDAYVLMRETTYPGIVVKARPIGVMHMIDGGEEDNKLICVPVDDPFYKEIVDIKQLSTHLLKEIQHFMEHYKDLEHKKVVVSGFKSANEAKEEFRKAVKAYKQLK